MQQVEKHCSGREVARRNEIAVTAAVAKFGHLRAAEIASAVWPHAARGEQMAQRTCRRLLTLKYLARKRNALGGVSYVLTTTGANHLTLLGYSAQNTLELSSVTGATFSHRTIGTRFLIEKQNRRFEVAGEYGIFKQRVPFSIKILEKMLNKKPDGLAWKRIGENGFEFEWIEVENAAKSKFELMKMLSVVQRAGLAIDSRRSVFLSKLTIVFDSKYAHAKRILKAADELWGNLPSQKRAEFERKVSLNAVHLSLPLRWHKYTTESLHEYRHRLTN